MKPIIYILLLFSLGLEIGCVHKEAPVKASILKLKTPFIQVVGIAQDAGFPQANCQKNCCRKYYKANHQLLNFSNKLLHSQNIYVNLRH